MRMPGGLAVRLLLALSSLSVCGCAASLQEIRHHPQQARLERFLAQILPHTKYPEKHYWVRVAEPTKHSVGLAVLLHRHIYLSESLLQEADDGIVLALLAHGVAHHRLHHHTQRGFARLLQRAAFKVGGFFVPGLSHGHYLGDPLTEAALSAGQEPSADAKTIVYLTRMGSSAQELVRALEWLVERGYAERIGRTTLRGPEFTARIARLRHASAEELPTDPDN